MERNLKLSVNQNFCLTSPKAGLVSKSRGILQPIEQGMPGDGLMQGKSLAESSKQTAVSAHRVMSFAFVTTGAERNLGILRDSASSVLKNNLDIGIY